MTTTENYYLVTAIVTYRVEQASSHNEAVSIVEHQLLPAPHLDGVMIEDIKDMFWSEIAEDENGIHYVNSGELDTSGW